MSASLYGRLVANKTALFVCDLQEKFANNIKYFPQVIINSKKLLDSAKILNVPVIYTEQYPKGLGHTVPELNITEYSSAKFEKQQFSMLVPALEDYMKKNHPNVDSIVLCGIEAHACIRHTVIDLLEKGFNVHVVVDACSSRTMVDRKYALKAIERMGAHLITAESTVFGFVPNAADPRFKQLQKLLMEPSADTGL